MPQLKNVHLDSNTHAKQMSLQEGVWLEGRQKLLPWGLSFSALKKAVPPDFIVRSQRSFCTVVWTSQIWDGLACQLSSSYTDGSEGHTVLGSLQIAFDEGPYWCYGADIKRFHQLLSGLNERFGKPAVPVLEEEYYAKAVWQLDDVRMVEECFDGMNGGLFVFLYKNQYSDGSQVKAPWC